MDMFATRRIGATDLRLPRLGMGGASLGDMHAVIPEAQASGAVEAAFDAGVAYFDTSPWYGGGKSELRIGHVLRTKPRGDFLLSTKVGRVHRRPENPDDYRHPAWKGGLPFEPRFDYGRDAILKSYEMSLARLGMNRVDALLIHDLDPGHQRSEDGVAKGLDQLDADGWRALADLKAAGEIGAIGAGVNLIGMIPRFLERYPLDFFLVAMPYTLLDQRGLAELDLCQERGVSVVIGAPFASGVLARGPVDGATYGYMAAKPAVIERATRIQAACARHGVALGAAALQFVFGHPAVASVIPGPISRAEVEQNLRWFSADIPGDLWTELSAEGLIDAAAPTPSA